MKLKTAFCSAAVLTASLTGSAMAMEQGDWLIRFGGSYIEPKSHNSDIVSVDSAGSFTFNFSYMMTANWSVEVLAAWPFEHDIALVDGPDVGSTKQLPPTVSLQYHFLPGSTFQPYIGAGINYTLFFDEKLYGPLEGASLDLDGSWGLEGEIGADIMLNEVWFLNLDARYIDIDTDASVNGESIGTVAIDPWVYSINLGYRF